MKWSIYFLLKQDFRSCKLVVGAKGKILLQMQKINKSKIA